MLCLQRNSGPRRQKAAWPGPVVWTQFPPLCEEHLLCRVGMNSEGIRYVLGTRCAKWGWHHGMRCYPWILGSAPSRNEIQPRPRCERAEREAEESGGADPRLPWGEGQGGFMAVEVCCGGWGGNYLWNTSMCKAIVIRRWTVTVTRQLRQNNLLPHSNSTWLRRWQLNSPQRPLSQVRQSLRLNLVSLLHIPSHFFDGVSLLGPFVSQKTNPASATHSLCAQPAGSVLLTRWPTPPLAAPEALGCREEETRLRTVPQSDRSSEGCRLRHPHWPLVPAWPPVRNTAPGPETALQAFPDWVGSRNWQQTYSSEHNSAGMHREEPPRLGQRKLLR